MGRPGTARPTPVSPLVSALRPPSARKPSPAGRAVYRTRTAPRAGPAGGGGAGGYVVLSPEDVREGGKSTACLPPAAARGRRSGVACCSSPLLDGGGPGRLGAVRATPRAVGRGLGHRRRALGALAPAPRVPHGARRAPRPAPVPRLLGRRRDGAVARRPAAPGANPRRFWSLTTDGVGHRRPSSRRRGRRVGDAAAATGRKGETNRSSLRPQSSPPRNPGTVLQWSHRHSNTLSSSLPGRGRGLRPLAPPPLVRSSRRESRARRCVSLLRLFGFPPTRGGFSPDSPGGKLPGVSHLFFSLGGRRARLERDPFLPVARNRLPRSRGQGFEGGAPPLPGGARGWGRAHSVEEVAS